ncbi:xyloglucan O-acetyltransferase 1-like [Cicer arietinum]|uniref:Protein ALTERED XYLOGLUCAN 4-like n=1 Tax=Cicer arietinum TaxID=3827 RepID=A0A1S2XIJ0_CICAR|nr:protein ALTERED XYLOGLUCAN 4-like [Cicer arietinum]
MKSTKTTLKDDDVDYDSLSPFNKTLFPHTLHLLLPVALLPIAIVLLCLYFYPLPLTQSQPQPHQLHHVTLSPQVKEKHKAYNNSCDYFNGEWIHDKRGPLYNGTTCATIKEGQNCITNGRPNSTYLYWRWKPNQCNLPRFQPNTFLQLSLNKHIAFVGDSLARNQFESLLCMLSSVSKPKPVHHKGSHWWHFPSHNATLSLYWSPFFVQGQERSKSGPNYNTMYLDRVNQRWSKDMDRMDLIVLSFGNWFNVPSIYYENGLVLGCLNCSDLNYTDIGFYVPIRKALRTSLDAIIERRKGKGNNGIGVIVRTFSPSHFDGDWDKAGTCSKTEPYGNGEKKLEGMDGEIRKIEIEEVESAKVKANKFGGIRFELLDVTELSLLRPDGHPGPYMNHFLVANGVSNHVQNDCVHWCLPGPIDTWNEIFLEMMKKWEWEGQPRNED